MIIVFYHTQDYKPPLRPQIYLDAWSQNQTFFLYKHFFCAFIL